MQEGEKARETMHKAIDNESDERPKGTTNILDTNDCNKENGKDKKGIGDKDAKGKKDSERRQEENEMSDGRKNESTTPKTKAMGGKNAKIIENKTLK